MPAPPLSPPHHRVWPARQSRRQDAVLPGKQRTLDPRIGTVEGRRDAASSSVAHGERAWEFAVATISANLNVAGSYHWRTVQQQRLCRLKQGCTCPGTRRTMPAGCVHPLRARAFKFETRRANDPTDPGPKCELTLKRDSAVGARRRARARAATIPSRRGSCDSSDAMRCDECDMMRCDRCPSLFVISRAPLCCTAVAECS